MSNRTVALSSALTQFLLDAIPRADRPASPHTTVHYYQPLHSCPALRTPRTKYLVCDWIFNRLHLFREAATGYRCDPNTSLSLTYRLLAVLPMYVRASRMRAYRAGPGLLEPASTHPARPAHPFAAHCNLAQKAAASSKPPCVVGGSRGCGPGLAVPLLLLHRPTHRAKAGTLRGHSGSVIVRSSGAPV